MKILDKLKNALFEEEYVEVEEKKVKPVKPKKEKPKKEINRIKEEKRLKNVVLTNYEDEEKPIAKKILPKTEAVSEKRDISVKDKEKEKKKEKPAPPKPKKEEFKFPTISDDEFVNRNSSDITVTELEEEITSLYSEDEDDVKLYKTSKEDEYIKKYTANEYGNYGKNKEKKVFKPSPNISPIFGIIDDNYSREREQPKKEVRLTGVVRNDRVDVDDVRRKAYGLNENSGRDFSVTDALSDDHMLVDLRDDTLPEVNKVTVGDAEEYFEDLGLEYNKDYIDAKKEKASGRRLKSEEEYDTPMVQEEPVLESNEEMPDFLKEAPNEAIEQSQNDNDEDNLFDLIDSMYDQ